ncbi:MAG: carbohydrate kinase family protein [Patescibacteria group bacterium]
MYQLLAIGDPVIDTHVRIDDSDSACQLIPHGKMKLCFDYGSKIPIRHSFQSLGGNAANVSIGATKLGLSSAILSTIGDDPNGKLAIRELAKYGVDTSLLTTDKKSNTRYSVVLNYKEERTILAYSDRKNYYWPKPEPKADWIYYTGLSEGFYSLHEDLMAYLRRHPTIRLAFNPGANLLKYDRDYLPEILSRADLLIVNLEEAESITGKTLAKEKSVSALIHHLLAEGAKEVVLTDAVRGAWAANQDEVWHMKALPVPVISMTGAGDAFSAAYLAARIYKLDLRQALAWGIANGAAVIQKEGPHDGLLDRKEIELFLNKFKTIQPGLV